MDVAVAMLNKSEELTFESEKELALKANIEKLAKSGSMTEEDRIELISKTVDLLGESGRQIQEALEAEKDSLEIEKQKVQNYNQQADALSQIRIQSALINQQREASAIAAAKNLELTTKEKNEDLEELIRGRALSKIKRETGAFSTLESEGLRLQAAQDVIDDAINKSDQARNTANKEQKS